MKHFYSIYAQLKDHVDVKLEVDFLSDQLFFKHQNFKIGVDLNVQDDLNCFFHKARSFFSVLNVSKQERESFRSEIEKIFQVKIKFKRISFPDEIIFYDQKKKQIKQTKGILFDKVAYIPFLNKLIILDDLQGKAALQIIKNILQIERLQKRNQFLEKILKDVRLETVL